MTACSISQIAVGYTTCDNRIMTLDHTSGLQDVPSHYIKVEPCEDGFSNIQVDGYVYEQIEGAFATRDNPNVLCESCTDSELISAQYESVPRPVVEKSFQSPGQQRRTSSSRKERTPNTLRVMMEKHRHSERLRHHTLNESLKVICKQVPGSAEDGKETKVVMMQRIICYIAYLENTIDLLCTHLGIKPHPHWILLTTRTQDYLANFEVDSSDSDSWTSTRTCCSQEKVSFRGGCVKSIKVEADSETDSTVPVATTAGGKEEGAVLSQDSGVAASSITGEDEQPMQTWTLVTDAAASTGDFETFFGSSTDDGISAMLEISSSVEEEAQRSYDCTVEPANKENSRNGSELDSQVVPKLETALVSYRDVHSDGIEHGVRFSDLPASCDQLYQEREVEVDLSEQDITLSGKWLRHHHPSLYVHKNKRKQYSPKRSPFSNLTNWKPHSKIDHASRGRGTGRRVAVVQLPNQKKASKPKGIQVMPCNVHCKQGFTETYHMHFTRNSALHRPLVSVAFVAKELNSLTAATEREKPPVKVDLRKTSWMNGFMMFSRLNRRRFIEAHPGVHTSNISKIMGHAWRSMSPQEQAPFKEKAKLCAQELYRSYTSTVHEASTKISDEAPSTSTAESNSSMIPVESTSKGTCI